MEEGPEAAAWRELVALYRNTNVMTHLVYFIGGPRDLSKQVFPGASPGDDRIRVLEAGPVRWHVVFPGEPVSRPEHVTHVYRLYPAPFSTMAAIFIAVYIGADT